MNTKDVCVCVSVCDLLIIPTLTEMAAQVPLKCYDTTFPDTFVSFYLI